ncbi:Aste57867_13138 [Aphanomyces stellatus]|uniref:Aste57867_13138 protein n=1 Tax=Aphanomyces stellatus TaxID=120398 RepID=A0A485KXN9_9STRA|nr:hypothetical protein As57867_013089 [Aphanomyces stellatus]VFT89980.1 Aste57867_13138 [Aphanomyces stellatus]
MHDQDDGGFRIDLRRNVRFSARRWLADTNATDSAIQFDEVPLGVGVGTHYAEIYLGLPPQKASVIIDTGSHMTALPCSSCIECGDHTDPPYEVRKSTTANYLTCAEYTGRCAECDANQCRVEQRYAEGSMWSALMVSEVCWIGPLQDDLSNAAYLVQKYGVRFPIGCQTKETGLFITQKENGIMGMSQDPNTIVPFLVQAGVLQRKLFSICFADAGGTMVLGGVDPRLHLAPPMYTPLQTTSGWFTVEVLDILIGNTSLGLAPSYYNTGRGVIVDSGSTDTYFPASVQSTFAALYLKLAGRVYHEDESIKLTPAAQRLLPNIQIVLRGNATGSSVVLTIPPTQYLTASPDDGTVTNNIHFTEHSGGVLGASTMMNFDVIFDMEAQAVGFAPSHCGLGPSVGDTHPAISRGQWTDKTFWDSYGSIVSVALACSLFGVTIFLLRFVYRQCRQRQWTELALADDGTPRHAVSPIGVHDEEAGDVPLRTPASPQRKLSRSPELHRIQELDDDE